MKTARLEEVKVGVANLVAELSESEGLTQIERAAAELRRAL